MYVDQKIYNFLSALVFGMAFLLHTLRLYYDLSLKIGDYIIGKEISWLAVLITGYMVVNAYKLSGGK